MNISKKKIVIKGHKVKNVGYRPFLFEVATRKLVPRFDAVNKKEVDKDGNETIEVFIAGPENYIDNFIEFIKDENNKPEEADVESIEVVEKDYKGGIMTTESFSMWLNSNQLYKMTTIGTKILIGQENLIQETNTFRQETNENFEIMDKKYDAISKGMFAIVDEIRDTNRRFENKIEKIDIRIEKTDKNIESLLKILVEKEE